MERPPIPKHEAARLAELEQYKILDTAPEEAFDGLTRLAAQICGTHIALVSLIDTHRQWFKAKVGIDAPETPRDIAFCAHAIHQSDLLIVPEPLMSKFMTNRKKEVVTMREALAQQDLETVRKVAHGMKGAGGSYGFDHITLMATTIEHTAKSGTSAGLTEELDRLAVYLEQVQVIFD